MSLLSLEKWKRDEEGCFLLRFLGVDIEILRWEVRSLKYKKSKH